MRKVVLLLTAVLTMLACSKGHVYQEAPFAGLKVTIDTTVLKEGIPVFYTFRYDGRNINYIILKTGNDIQSYFDACAECYPRKKGFRYENGSLVCNVCNVGHSIYTLKEGIGSCYPIKLKGILIGNIYEIDKDKIIEGKGYF